MVFLSKNLARKHSGFRCIDRVCRAGFNRYVVLWQGSSLKRSFFSSSDCRLFGEREISFRPVSTFSFVGSLFFFWCPGTVKFIVPLGAQVGHLLVSFFQLLLLLLLSCPSSMSMPGLRLLLFSTLNSLFSSSFHAPVCLILDFSWHFFS